MSRAWLPRHCSAGLLVLAALLAVPACSPPKGDTGGRIDPYESTAADAASRQASIPSLLEFSDQAAARLAYDLVNIPQVQQSQTQLVLELGSLQNHTHTTTNDFELIQHRVRGALLQSQLIRGQFLVVESRQRMDQELERVTGINPAAATSPSDQTARYDPKLTYVLQGDFYESRRGDRRQYYFEFMLTNLASRQIVFSHSYDLGQVR